MDSKNPAAECAQHKQNTVIHASDSRRRNQKASEQVSSVTTEAVKLSAQKGQFSGVAARS
jgi:hypothetical protein